MIVEESLRSPHYSNTYRGCTGVSSEQFLALRKNVARCLEAMQTWIGMFWDVIRSGKLHVLNVERKLGWIELSTTLRLFTGAFTPSSAVCVTKAFKTKKILKIT